MAKNNLIGGSIWDEYSQNVQDRMNNPKFMGEITEDEAKARGGKLIVADFGAESWRRSEAVLARRRENRPHHGR